VIYGHERDQHSDSSRAARILFGLAGVAFRQHIPTCERYTLELLPPQVKDDSNLKKTEELSATAMSQFRDECKTLLLQEAGYVVPDEASKLKRQDYLPWDDYFMSVAFLSAQRSKDPNTQVGACIVNPSKRVVGIGYNGFPAGCSDDVLPWTRNAAEGTLHTKYPFVCHAEANAILNKGAADVRGSTIYVALFPCKCSCFCLLCHSI
jgi:deoxycytidylate deaminase